MKVTVLVFDSVVKLPAEANGAVVVGGSHAAVYAAYMSAKFGCRAAIHHDAGIGNDEAGVSGLVYADKLGMAMAAVATASARIGDGQDLHQRGIISRANTLAAACGVTPGMSCTREQALGWLREDVRSAEAAVHRLVAVPLEQHQFDALVSFTFNLGQGALAQSTLLKLLNAGRCAETGPQFLRWNRGPNGPLEGLTRRRAAEKAMFEGAGIHAVGVAA